MKTLDAIYNEYKENRTPEVEEALCGRIERLAGIMLTSFKIRRTDQNYEEYMQSAYLLFFELLATFDPSRGKLEGYFMVSYKYTLIDLIKDKIKRQGGIVAVGEEALDEKNPYNILLVDDLVDKLYDNLDKQEQVVATYLFIGVNTAEEIAQIENTEPIIIEGVLDSVRRKATALFFEDGDRTL